MEDLTPELLATLQRAFQTKFRQNQKLKTIQKLVDLGDATYQQANEYAIEVGEILASVFKENLSSDNLPNGRMYYNIAKKVVEPMMVNNHVVISDNSKAIQTLLNHQAGLGIQGQEPPLNQDKIDGIITRLSREEHFDDVMWILDEPIINFSQSIIDDAIATNVDFHKKAGLNPKITRTAEGGACDWCRSVAGVFDYGNEPPDFYRRHRYCRCIVEFNPKDGRGIQDSHSKRWFS